MIIWYDPDGNPIGLWEWAALIEANGGSIRIARNDVDLPGGGQACVSTVWLGIDYSMGLGGPPLIFETMVFFDAGDYTTGDFCERTPTREAALAMHDQAISWASNLGVEPVDICREQDE